MISVIEKQLAAFNAKDIEALLDTYAEDAVHVTLQGDILARGHAEMRPRFVERFQEPDLRAKLINRTVMGNIVVDLEVITRTFPEGKGTLELLCIYEVQNGKIQRATFAAGEKIVHVPQKVL